MTQSRIETLLLLLLMFVKEKYAQPTAVVTPGDYNASLDPQASFTFHCDVTGVNGIQWLVDGLLVSRQDIRNHGISESGTITLDETAGRLRTSLSIVKNITNNDTTIVCIATNTSPNGGISSASSKPVLFKIQGLLDPPSNLMLSEPDNVNQHLRRLSHSR